MMTAKIEPLTHKGYKIPHLGCLHEPYTYKRRIDHNPDVYIALVPFSCVEYLHQLVMY
jgi:hypothetical protein